MTDVRSRLPSADRGSAPSNGDASAWRPVLLREPWLFRRLDTISRLNATWSVQPYRTETELETL